MFAQREWPWVRVTGILGVVFFVGVVIGLAMFIPVQPSPTDPIEDIREFIADDASLVHTANWILGVVLVFAFLPFAAGLRAILAKDDVDAGIWTRSAYGAAVALIAVTGLGSAFLASAMLAFEDAALADDLLRLALWTDAYVYSFVASIGIALFLAANAVVVLRTGALWRWLGWLGLASAVVSLVGAWWPVTADPEGVLTIFAFLSVPLLAIWTLLAGINLLRVPPAASG